MAVVDEYVDANLASNQKRDPNIAGGSRSLIYLPLVSVAAADDDGSKYRLGRFNSNLVFYDIKIATTAITGGTDYDLGIYEVNFGPAVSANLLMDGQTMAVAAGELNGLANVSVPNLNKPLWVLLGFSKDPLKQLDLVLTANTVGSAAGSILVRVLTAQY